MESASDSNSLIDIGSYPSVNHYSTHSNPSLETDNRSSISHLKLQVTFVNLESFHLLLSLCVQLTTYLFIAFNIQLFAPFIQRNTLTTV